jgi:hypothetical protein
VPPFDASWLIDASFDTSLPLVPPSPPSRDKGWRAFPIWSKKTPPAFGVLKDKGLVFGFGLDDAKQSPSVEAGFRAIAAQEIRNARGGHYTFCVKASGEAASADEFEKLILGNFTCKLLLFRFRDTNKDPRTVDELAAAEFRPAFGKTETFKVDRFLGSKTPGANFPIGNGLGVAIVLEKKTPGSLSAPMGQRAAIRIHSVTLDFSPGARDENTLL